ncbi:MAG: ribbon-helix-helix protein, CopG family [Anaerolineae bacterium]
MAGTLVRTQVLLEKEQQKRLAEMAAAEGKSVSALLREAVETLLAANEREAKRARALVALEELRKLRMQIEETHGIYHGNPVEEVRAEREAQWDEFFRQEGRDCPAE